jgi:hypothetical protein
MELTEFCGLSLAASRASCRKQLKWRVWSPSPDVPGLFLLMNRACCQWRTPTISRLGVSNLGCPAGASTLLAGPLGRGFASAMTTRHPRSGDESPQAAARNCWLSWHRSLSLQQTGAALGERRRQRGVACAMAPPARGHAAAGMAAAPSTASSQGTKHPSPTLRPLAPRRVMGAHCKASFRRRPPDSASSSRPEPSVQERRNSWCRGDAQGLVQNCGEEPAEAPAVEMRPTHETVEWHGRTIDVRVALRHDSRTATVPHFDVES